MATTPTTIKLTQTDRAAITTLMLRHDLPTMAEAIRFALMTAVSQGPKNNPKKSQKTA